MPVRNVNSCINPTPFPLGVALLVTLTCNNCFAVSQKCCPKNVDTDDNELLKIVQPGTFDCRTGFAHPLLREAHTILYVVAMIYGKNENFFKYGLQ